MNRPKGKILPKNFAIGHTVRSVAKATQNFTKIIFSNAIQFSKFAKIFLREKFALYNNSNSKVYQLM